MQVLVLLACVYFVLAKDQLPCHPLLTVDITLGRKLKDHSILHDNITYTQQNYYKDKLEDGNVTTYGCICNIIKCVRKCCPFGKAHNGSVCVDSKHDLSINFTVPVHEGQDKSKEPANFKYLIGDYCPHDGYVLDTANFEEDVHFLQKNGSLFMPNHGEDSDEYRHPHDFCVDISATANTTEFLTLLCFNSPAMDPQKLYSIGMLISMPFLVMTLLVYACVPDLQNIHGKCLICYVISLLTAYVFLVCVQLDTSKTDSKFCSTAPFIIYFSFMVSFMWLHVMCIDIWWTFSGLRGYKGSAKKSEQKRFLLYSLYAWGVPLLMLAITLALQFAPNLPDWVVTPQIAVTKCWFPDDKTVGYYFYGPILLIILVNLGLFSYTTFKIWRVQRSTDQSMKKNESQRHGTDSDKQRYKLYLKLMFVFGVNWLMEIISWLADGPQWLWYVTDMCNALYGVFIFFIFVCKANVWKLVRKRYHVMMGRPYLAQTFAPTSSTRSTAVTSTSAGNGTQDSFALTTSTAA